MRAGSWYPIQLHSVPSTIVSVVLLVTTAAPGMANAAEFDEPGILLGPEASITLLNPSTPGAPNLFAGARLFVDAQSSARRQMNTWQITRPQDVPILETIASTPQADWMGDWNSDVRAAVDTRVSLAALDNALPVLVAYNIPMRDCGSYSGGGAKTPEAYLQWIRSFSDGIGSRQAAVILEPDALPQLDCLSPANKAVRLSLMNQAVEILAERPNVAVYLDIGNPNWLSVTEAASRLDLAGISGARGFSLNVSNFYSTADNLTYGEALSSVLDGKTFVVDTGRNGLGPGSDWCNPAGRALGESPTAVTGVPEADAFLWIKRPGESDGTCNGGPVAGAWWPDYALGLAQRSAL